MSALLMPVLAERKQKNDVSANPMLFRRARTWWLMLVFFIIAGQNSWFTEAVPQGKELLIVKQSYGKSNVVLQILTLSIYVITFGLVFRHLRVMWQALLRQRTFLYFIGLAVASSLWSQAPGETVWRLPLLFSLMALGWYIGLYYTADEQIQITLTLGLLLASSSALLALALPQYGLDTGGGWKGVMGTKNQFGHAMLFLFSGVLFRTDRRHRMFWNGAGLLGFFSLVMARSAESLVLLVLIVAIRFYGPFLRRTRRESVPFLIFVAVAGVLALLLGRVTMLALLGRDPTLTGRTGEWATILPYAMKHFWLGYGYHAFWTGEGDSLQVMHSVKGLMHGSDSGYLDLFLQFGIIGLGSALAILLGSAYTALKLCAADRPPLALYWYFSLVCVSLVGNVADAYFPLTGGSPEVMFVFACVSVWKLSTAKQSKSNYAYV